MINVGQLASRNVLFVDDERVVRDSMQETLQRLFNKAYLACNGAEALEICRNVTVDFVITDLEMPCVDGIEFIKELRSISPYKPIIVLSAHTDKKYLLHCCNLNIQAYIVKPITLEKLHNALGNVMLYLGLDVINDVVDVFPNGVKYNKAASLIEYPDNTTYLLKKKEKLFLDLLLQYHNKIVSYSMIEDVVWPDHWEVMSNLALRTVVKNLRKAIGKELIMNLSGQGYQIVL